MSEVSKFKRRPFPPWQFSLGAILLVVTLVSVCLALLRLVPCLGALLIIICVPAIIRTAINVRYYARLGERMTITEKISDFALSFFLVLWAGVLAIFAGSVVAMILIFAIMTFLDPPSALGWVMFPSAAVTAAAFVRLLWIFRPGAP